MQLKLYNRVENLQPQYSAYLAATGGARSVVPAPGDSLLTVELGQSLELEALLHKLLSNPEIKSLATLAIERQGSTLEFISPDPEAIDITARTLLEQIECEEPVAEPPLVANRVLIEELTALHPAVLCQCLSSSSSTRSFSASSKGIAEGRRRSSISVWRTRSSISSYSERPASIKHNIAPARTSASSSSSRRLQKSGAMSAL